VKVKARVVAKVVVILAEATHHHSRSASESGSYTGSSGSRSESYTSGSLEDLPNRWKSDKQQPLSKKADDPSGKMKYDRHKALGVGNKR
jgi:hypothetical protein